MKRNGFTLIELLAVIVILAIIALIATPIILGIINDAREKANERSVELYASAVRNAIASYQLTRSNAPESFDDLDIQYDGEVECTVEELYSDGSFYLDGCKVNDGEVEYTYGTKQEKGIKLSEVCTIAADSTVTGLNAGAKYNCTVNPNKSAYTFYVLNTPAEGATSVNLIMDSNITSTGIAIKEENPSDYGLVEWTSDEYLEEHASQEDLDNFENLNIYGPVTAMEHLQAATSEWTKVNPQTISTFNYDNGDVHEMSKYTLNARLPYYNEISNVSLSKLYLIDYLNGGDALDFGIIGRNRVYGVYGYWTITASSSRSVSAFVVEGSAEIYDERVNNYSSFGVRPVINLSI